MVEDDNDNAEYQLSDDDETIYEPEEEHPSTDDSSKPKQEKPGKPSKKRAFLAIIVIIVVIFVGYRLIRSISSKKKISQVSSVSSVVKTTPIKKTLPVVVKTTPEQVPSSVTKDIAQLRQGMTAMETLKKQQSDTQTSLQGFHQKISSIDERMNNLQNLTQGMANQVKKVQQIQQKQQQANQAVIARRARARAARISQFRRQKSYFVQAVIPGRAWLRGADGSAITITKGDKIPGYGQVVAIDPYSGVVAMSSGMKLRYGVGAAE